MIEIKCIKEIDELMRWRKEVIETVFGQTPSEELMEENRRYYRRHIADDSHLAYVILYEGMEAGCGAICLTDELPSPDNPSGHCAYIMNIYVREPFREKGLGHAIVTALMEEAKKRDCGKIYLETTDVGRHLYESLGFRDLPDMMKLYLK